MKILVLLFLFSGINGGQQLSVHTEEKFTFKEHRAIVLSAGVEIPDGFKLARIQWRTRSIEVDLRPHTTNNRHECSVWAKPGTYEIMLDAWLINWEAKEFDTVERIFTLTVEGARPPPIIPDDPDDPDDPPDIDDTPTSGKVTSIIIAEASKLNASERGKLFDLRTFVDGKLNYSHFEFPPDAENADGSVNKTVKSYADKATTLPFVFFVQLDGSGHAVVKWSGELKELSSSDLISKLKEIHGATTN